MPCFKKFLHLMPVFFLERTAKALSQFLLEEEEKKKMTAQFFEWKLGQKTTRLKIQRPTAQARRPTTKT